MGVPAATQKREDLLSRENIEEIYSQIARSCARARINPGDAEDLAQDIFLCLLRIPNLARPLTAPFVAGVTRNFIMRYRRHRRRMDFREGAQIALLSPEPFGDPADSIDRRHSIERLSKQMGKPDRELLRLVCLGMNFTRAATRLGIPRGSHAYFLKRLQERLRKRRLRPFLTPPASSRTEPGSER